MIGNTIQEYMDKYNEVVKEVILPMYDTTEIQRLCSADGYGDNGLARKLAPMIKRYKTHLEWCSSSTCKFTKPSDATYIKLGYGLECMELPIKYMEALDGDKLKEYITRVVHILISPMISIYMKIIYLNLLLIVMSPYHMLNSLSNSGMFIKGRVSEDMIALKVHEFLTNYGFVQTVFNVTDMVLNDDMLTALENTDKLYHSVTPLIASCWKMFCDTYYNNPEAIIMKYPPKEG